MWYTVHRPGFGSAVTHKDTSVTDTGFSDGEGPSNSIRGGHRRDCHNTAATQLGPYASRCSSCFFPGRYGEQLHVRRDAHIDRSFVFSNPNRHACKEPSQFPGSMRDGWEAGGERAVVEMDRVQNLGCGRRSGSRCREQFRFHGLYRFRKREHLRHRMRCWHAAGVAIAGS
jgi:hypothetical protein